MQQDIKSYQKILVVNTHIAFICYIIGYSLGMLDYFYLGYHNLLFQDLIIISLLLVSYLLFIIKKISFQNSIKALALIIVSDLLYPGIISYKINSTAYHYDDNITLYIILVFAIAFITDKKFTIFIIILTIILFVINSVLFNHQLLFETVSETVLFIGGSGTFGIVFDDLINKLLKKANDSKNKIQVLSDWKQDIIRNTIHDLKVPVCSILNLSTLKENSNSSKIYYQALNINKQLEKILDIERLEEPNTELNMKSISIQDLIDQATNTLKTQSKEKNISIRKQFNITGKLICDIDLMARLIVNILSNAIKFSPINSTIHVIVNNKDLCCKISIIDNGEGIPKEHLQHIFEKFYSTTNTKSKNNFPTGLGLAFCKLVANVHKGHILVESRIGKGTVFEIIIPEFTTSAKTNEFTLLEPNKISFTQKERKILYETCQKIKTIPVYRASEIIHLTQHLSNNKSLNIINWCESLNESVYTGNAELYNKLIQLCVLKDK